MRDLRELNQYRNWEGEKFFMDGVSNPRPDIVGIFEIPSCKDRKPLRCIVSADPSTNWDHVSVSRKERVPNWYEMEQIKKLFFKDDEVAMQLHVTAENHVNVHPHCLHLWRPMNVDIPLPPKGMVG